MMSDIWLSDLSHLTINKNEFFSATMTNNQTYHIPSLLIIDTNTIQMLNLRQSFPFLRIYFAYIDFNWFITLLFQCVYSPWVIGKCFKKYSVIAIVAYLKKL